MNQTLTRGNITKTMLLFALPMMAGNLLQQFYNITDTFIVGKFLGKDALAAVGSAYTLMTFLTSILLGLSMGNGVFVSICFGKKEEERLKTGTFLSFLFIAAITIFINILVFAGMDFLLVFLNIPAEIHEMMRQYLWIIFWGLAAVFLYNYFTALLRSIGNSMVPLLFLVVSTIVNIALDLLFVITFRMGVGGAALATVIAQYIAGIGIALYTIFKWPRISYKADSYALGQLYFKRNFPAFHPDLPAAVGNEFWYFNGSGTGQQLWHCGDGSFCSCS